MKVIDEFRFACAESCGWTTTTQGEEASPVTCERCGAGAVWLNPFGPDTPPPPPPTALSWLRRALATVAGERTACLAPALLAYLATNHVALVPYELRDDCALWGVRGIIRAELERRVPSAWARRGADPLQLALGAVMLAAAANRREAEDAQEQSAAFLAGRRRLA